MTKNMHFHFMLPTSKICTIKVRTSTIITLTRRHTLLGCETKLMESNAMETKTMETKALIPIVASKVGLEGGGVIRLLDNIKNLPLDHAMFLAVSQLRSIQVSPYTCNSRVYAAESKLHM